MTYRRTGNVLVFFPLLYTLTVVLYFAFLPGSVKLPDVFPWFFYMYFPAVVISVFFTVKALIHLFSLRKSAATLNIVLWVILILLLNPIAVPVYRYLRIR